jgi:hypothetical protein
VSSADSAISTAQISQIGSAEGTAPEKGWAIWPPARHYSRQVASRDAHGDGQATWGALLRWVVHALVGEGQMLAFQSGCRLAAWRAASKFPAAVPLSPSREFLCGEGPGEVDAEPVAALVVQKPLPVHLVDGDARCDA